jgi:integrase
VTAHHHDLNAARRLSVSAYDREALLAHVAKVLPRYQWDLDGARRVRRVTGLTADVLDALPGECLQGRWEAFEAWVWPNWVTGSDRLPAGNCWTWGAWMVVIARLVRPSLTLSDIRLNQWVARLPADDPLLMARDTFVKTAESLEWGTPAFKGLALRSGLHLLLSRGYDGWDQLTEADLASLPLRTHGSDLLDAVLSRLGVIERGPLRGTTRRMRRERLSPTELAEAAEMPAWCKPVTALYLETYAVRLSDRYATLRHKVRALSHFWRYLEVEYPEITACRDVTPAATRGFVANVVEHARKVARRPNGEVTTSAHAWLVDVRVFFADICTWATEEGSPFAEHAPPTVPLTRHDFLDVGFRQARLRRDARMTATVLDLEREMPNIRAFALRRWHEAEQDLAAHPGDRFTLAGETTAFWDWALVELLVTSGVRIEEACELTTFGILRRQLPDGRVYYLLHVKPSKLGGARTIPIGDGLGRVIAEIVRHIRRFYGTDAVPACDRRDDHEIRPLPRAPYLLQGAGHPSAMGANTIRYRLRKLSLAAGARCSDGSPLELRPHDCRRVFASEHLNNNTPVQVIQALLGHTTLDTVMIYAKLYPAHLVEEYRRAVHGMYLGVYGDEALRAPTTEEWAAFSTSCSMRDMGTHLCALPTGEHCPRGLVCLGCTHAQPKRSAIPVFRRMLASHTRAVERAREVGEPPGQVAAREMEIERIRSALRRAEELTEDVAAAIESVAG